MSACAYRRPADMSGTCVIFDLCPATTAFDTHPFISRLSGTTRVSRYQKGQTNLDFTEGSGGEWQWHQLGHMQVCISLQIDNHVRTHHSVFLQVGCPSCCPTNSVKALKALITTAFDLESELFIRYGSNACWIYIITVKYKLDNINIKIYS